MLLLLILILQSTGAFADSPFCLPRVLAARSSTPGCELRYELEHGSVCLRRGGPLFRCATWEGKWKARSSPENDPDVPSDKGSHLVFLAEAARLPTVPMPSLISMIEGLRVRASALFRPADRLGLIRRLLLDERMPESPQGVLRLLGFIHLLTATGIHLYALARVTEAFAVPVLALGGATPRAALLLARATAFLMTATAWILSGMRPGMLRPWIIVTVRTAASECGFRWRNWMPLGIALVADAVVATARLMSGGGAWAPGRLHYALAVGGGLLALGQRPDQASEGERGVSTLLREHLLLSFGSWILVAPLDLWQTGLVSVATPILSLLTLPLFSMIVYPLSIFAVAAESVGLNPVAGQLAHVISLALSEWTLWLAPLAMRFETLWLVPRSAMLIGASLGAFATLLPRGVRGWLIAVFLMAIAAERLARSPASAIRPPLQTGARAEQIEQLDVGQGDAALVRGDDGTSTLIDSGDGRVLTEEGWIRLLALRQIRAIDQAALTHLDRDHAGGLEPISRLVQIGCVALSPFHRQSEKGQSLEKALARSGVPLGTWKDCIPYPSAVDLRSRGNDGNSRMSGLFIPLTNGDSYLNLGDSDGFQEESALPWALALRARHPGRLVLKASHHGSRFSSSPLFLKALRPDLAWISTGVGNRFGHPALQTLTRFHELRIPVSRTDEQGALRAGGDRRRR